MKLICWILSALMVVALPSATLAAPKKSKPVKTSKLFEFKGRYKGTVNYAGFASGTTTATISSQKKKDIGAINLSSILQDGSSTAPLSESITIKNRKATYVISILGATGIGRGNANVSKNTITYTCPFSVGQMSYVVQGKLTKRKRKVTILEFISLSGSAVPITYSLRASGK